MSIRLVCFDIDGTLVDACEWHYQALNKALKEIAGFEISLKDHESTFNALPTKTKLSILRDRGKLDEKLFPLIEEKKKQYTLDLIQEFAKPDPTKVELLAKLRERGINIACVTNGIEAAAATMLKATGQWPYVQFLVHNRFGRNPKPHAEPYIIAMVQFQSFPAETVIVEDSEIGLQSAKNAGGIIWKVNDPSEVTWENFLILRPEYR